MSSKWFRFISIVSILLILGLLAFVEFKELERLHAGIQQRQKLEFFDAKIQREVFDKTILYLASGNALQLNEAKNALIILLDTEVSSFSGTDKSSITKMMEAYLNFLNIDLLAAGKAVNNRAMLIDHNVDEIQFQIELLRRYSDKARGANSGYTMQYDLAYSNFKELLLMREMKRNAYFLGFSAEDYRQMMRLNDYMIDVAKELDRFPLLGVREAEQKNAPDLADLLDLSEEDSVPVDSGAEIKRQIHSLLVRYPKEVENTKKIYDSQKTSSVQSADLIAAIKNVLNSAQKQIDTSIEQSFERLCRTYIGLLLIMGVLFISLLFVSKLHQSTAAAS